MLYLILSIICSVTVGAIFKIARKFDSRTTQIVGWNYVFAVILCYIFFQPSFSSATITGNWDLYLPLCVLLPSVFLVMAVSIKHMGIVKTDAAQRLSLFIPILAAWFIFRENFGAYKIAGIAIGFPAIFLILAKKQDTVRGSSRWILPLLVLFGFGIIDVLFKHVAILDSTDFTTSLFIIFCGALALSAIVVAYDVLIRKFRLQLMDLAFGALVGIFNFGNIVFYLKAHKEYAENPSTVFAAMNMGVIVLASLTGVFVFKEKLSRKNYFGILLALVAIILITLSQIYRNI